MNFMGVNRAGRPMSAFPAPRPASLVGWQFCDDDTNVPRGHPVTVVSGNGNALTSGYVRIGVRRSVML